MTCHDLGSFCLGATTTGQRWHSMNRGTIAEKKSLASASLFTPDM
jgi:hypothetical protein